MKLELGLKITQLKVYKGLITLYHYNCCQLVYTQWTSMLQLRMLASAVMRLYSLLYMAHF